VVTLELSSGQTYRGKLLEGEYPRDVGGGGAILTVVAEDNMNVQLRDVTVTARDGKVTHLEQVYVRGSHVKLFIIPDMLR
jgi:small nuclear ribonucleoprotein (snRNP)-like protein